MAEIRYTGKRAHSVGAKKILDAVKVLNDSFYHFFEFKMRFSAEMLKRQKDKVGDIKRRMFIVVDTGSDPLKRLCTHLDGRNVFVQSVAGRLLCRHRQSPRKHGVPVTFCPAPHRGVNNRSSEHAHYAIGNIRPEISSMMIS